MRCDQDPMPAATGELLDEQAALVSHDPPASTPIACIVAAARAALACLPEVHGESMEPRIRRDLRAMLARAAVELYDATPDIADAFAARALPGMVP